MQGKIAIGASRRLFGRTMYYIAVSPPPSPIIFSSFFLTWMCLGRVNGKNLAERHLLVVVGTGLRLKKVAFRNLNLSKLGVCSLLLNVKVSCSDYSSQNLGRQEHEIECRSWFWIRKVWVVVVWWWETEFEIKSVRGSRRPTLDLDYLDKSIKWAGCFY